MGVARYFRGHLCSLQTLRTIYFERNYIMHQSFEIPRIPTSECAGHSLYLNVKDGDVPRHRTKQYGDFPALGYLDNNWNKRNFSRMQSSYKQQFCAFGLILKVPFNPLL